MIDQQLVHLIRSILADELTTVERSVFDGIVDTVEGQYAAVRLAGAESPALPGFYFAPSLAVMAGDHVLGYRRGGFQVILLVLDRNATAVSDAVTAAIAVGSKQISYPDSVAAAADYLAKMKRTADTAYRLDLGLAADDTPQLLLGDGTAALDTGISRIAAGILRIQDVAQLLAVAAPATPAAGYGRVYFDNLGNTRLHTKNSAGYDTILAGASWAPYAFPLAQPYDSVQGTTVTLAAVAGSLGGAFMVPIHVPAPMKLQTIWIRNVDVASLRTAEWRLYVDNGANALAEVAGANGTFSFTPTVASNRSSTPASPPIILSPGIYWLVVRNTSTAQTFGLGLLGGGTINQNLSRTVNTAAALAATVDTSAWVTNLGSLICRLQGRIGAEAGAF